MNENLEGEESILDCLSNQGVLDVYVVRGKVRVSWRQILTTRLRTVEMLHCWLGT